MNQKNNHPRINVGITDKKLSADYSIKFVTNNSSGAISTFLGNTRDNNLGRTEKFLEYEAYETMADMKLYEIANDMLSKWQIRRFQFSIVLGMFLWGRHH